MGRKLALVIGNSQYDDEGLARLATADVDVRELAGVLRADEMGQFENVTEVTNQSVAVVRRSIAHFFGDAKRDDLLLLYFSGHGVKDEQGHLYLAVRDTERSILAGTSIEAAFVTAQMDRSHSKRQILILDCCHSGAFAYGVKAGAAAVMGVGPAFEGNGYGRVVLTATDATQYAWEGNQVIGDSDKSVFTHYLLEGLRTGEADRDKDGLITIDELYDYVYEHVVSETPKQTPGKWTYRMHGEIVVARSPHRQKAVATLPQELQALIDSPFVRLRAEAIPELAGLLFGRHGGLVLAARAALERLSADDSRSVAAAAEEVLSKMGSESAAVEIAAKQHERRAADAVGRARGEFAAGRHESAVAALERFQPAHTFVSSVLGELRAEMERRRLDDERKRLELVRAAREKEVAAGIAAARMHIERGHFDDAARAVRRLHEVDPGATGVIALTEALEAGKLAAEEAERRRKEAQAGLERASKQFRRRDFTTALALVDDVLRSDPKNVAAIELRADIHRAVAEEAAAARVARAPRPRGDFRSGLAFLSASRLRRGALAATILLAVAVGYYGIVAPQPGAPVDSAPAAVQSQQPPPAVPAPAPTASAGPKGAPAMETPAERPPAETSADRTPAIVPAVVPPVQTSKPALRPPQPAERRPSAPAPRTAEPSSPPAPAAVDPQPNPAEVRARLARAERLLDTGEYDAALRAIDEALALDPKNAAIPPARQRILDAQAFERALRPKKLE